MSQPSGQQLPTPPTISKQASRRGFRYQRPLFWIALFGFLIPMAIDQVPREIGRWHLANAVRLRAKKEVESAYRELEAADYRFPNSPTLLIQRAEWKLKDGNTREALEDADKAVELSKENPLIRDARGDLLFTAGEFSRAIDDFKVAKQYSRRSGQPKLYKVLNHSAYARALAKTDLDEALDDVSEAIDIVSDDPEIKGSQNYFHKASFLDTRGYIYFLKGEYERALADLNVAVERIAVPASGDTGEGFVPPALKSLFTSGDGADNARGTAVVYYHRSLVFDALDRKDDAKKDWEIARQLSGREPDETLF